jgi:parallel beta-helix repeat protein
MKASEYLADKLLEIRDVESAGLEHVDSHKPGGISDLSGIYGLKSVVDGIAQDVATHKAEDVYVMSPPSPLTAAVGDGTTDDKAALQAMLDYISTAGAGNLIFPQNKIFAISEGLKFYSNTVIDLNGSTIKVVTSEDVIQYFPLYSAGWTDVDKTPENVVIKNGTIDGGLKCETGVFVHRSSNVTVEHCTIKNINNTTGGNKSSGIRFNHLTTGCKALYNDIYLLIDNPFGTLADAKGIYCASSRAGVVDNDDTLTYADGVDLSENHLIQGNNIYNGIHGIQLFSAQNCRIIGNYCYGQTHRGIILDSAAHYNNIIANNIENFISTGIHLSHGCNYNNITGNTLITTVSGIEGNGIKFYYGGKFNHVTGNVVKGTLYAAFKNSVGCVNNNFVGNEASYCGTGLEIESYINENSDYFNAGVFQPASPPEMEGIYAAGNSFNNCTNGIRIAQRGSIGLKYDIINSNKIGACTNGFVIVEEAPIGCHSLSIIGNSVVGGTTTWTLPRGTNHATEFIGNTNYNFTRQAGIIFWADTAGRLKFGNTHPSNIDTGGAAVAISYAGTTANRPGPDVRYTSMMYYDTTIGKPIWWTGTAWIDAAGNSV